MRFAAFGVAVGVAIGVVATVAGWPLWLTFAVGAACGVFVGRAARA